MGEKKQIREAHKNIFSVVFDTLPDIFIQFIIVQGNGSD